MPNRSALLICSRNSTSTSHSKTEKFLCCKVLSKFNTMEKSTHTHTNEIKSAMCIKSARWKGAGNEQFYDTNFEGVQNFAIKGLCVSVRALKLQFNFVLSSFYFHDNICEPFHWVLAFSVFCVMVFRGMEARNLSNQHFRNVYRLEIFTMYVYTYMSSESMLISFVKKNVKKSVECSPKMLWYMLAFYEWVKMSGMNKKQQQRQQQQQRTIWSSSMKTHERRQ